MQELNGNYIVISTTVKMFTDVMCHSPNVSFPKTIKGSTFQWHKVWTRTVREKDLRFQERGDGKTQTQHLITYRHQQADLKGYLEVTITWWKNV